MQYPTSNPVWARPRRKARATLALGALSLLLLCPLGAAQAPAAGPGSKPGWQVPQYADVKTPAPDLAPKRPDGPRDATPPAAPAPGGGRAPAHPRGARPEGPSSFRPDTLAAERLALDVDADGQLWAFGGTYKARFGRDGAEYVPFLGSDAPRNHPLRLALSAIEVDGAPLPLVADAQPAFEGRAAVFPRGACLERYELRVGAMEQLFTFDALPARGALELVLQVRTDLQHELVADGTHRFGCERGGVHVGAARAYDASGRRCDVPLEWSPGADGEQGRLTLRVPAGFVDEAAFPLVVDPLLTTWTAAATTRDELAADVTFDAQNEVFLVVWNEVFSAADHDVFGQLFDVNGLAQAGTGAYTDITTTSWTQPRCATNRLATEALVVATTASTTWTEVRGRTRDIETINQGAQFTIAAGLTDRFSADVGGDPSLVGPTYYLVTFLRRAGATDTDVFAQLVDPAGQLVGTVIPVDTSLATLDSELQVSSSNGADPASEQRWTLVWAREFSSVDRDIYAAEVSWSGAVVAPTYTVDYRVADSWAPAVSTRTADTVFGRTALVVYSTSTGLVDQLDAAQLHGGVAFAPTSLDALPGFGGPWGTGRRAPTVESDGQSFLVAWHQRNLGTADYDVFAAAVYEFGDGLGVSEGPVAVATSVASEHLPRLATGWSGGSYGWFNRAAIVHETQQTSVEIEGASFDMPVGYGGLIGINYCVGVVNSTQQSGYIYATGSSYAGGEPLHLRAFQLPPNNFAYFVGSPNAGFATPPATSGTVCVGVPLTRFNGPGQVLTIGASGSVGLEIDTLAIPSPTGATFPILAGQSFHFQAWYRDGALQTNNLTNGVVVPFQ